MTPATTGRPAHVSMHDGMHDNIDEQLSIYPPPEKNLRIYVNLVGRPVGGWGVRTPRPAPSLQPIRVPQTFG